METKTLSQLRKCSVHGSSQLRVFCTCFAFFSCRLYITYWIHHTSFRKAWRFKSKTSKSTHHYTNAEDYKTINSYIYANLYAGKFYSLHKCFFFLLLLLLFTIIMTYLSRKKIAVSFSSLYGSVMNIIRWKFTKPLWGHFSSHASRVALSESEFKKQEVIFESFGKKPFVIKCFLDQYKQSKV